MIGNSEENNLVRYVIKKNNKYLHNTHDSIFGCWTKSLVKAATFTKKSFIKDVAHSLRASIVKIQINIVYTELYEHPTKHSK